MKVLQFRRWSVSLVCLCVCLLAGCGDGSGPAGTVSGKVTLEGEPVTAGVVSLISSAGFSAQANLGSDGSFTITEEVPVGQYTVCVSPPEITEAPDEADVEVVKSAIPEGYFDESTSNITKEVTEGDNNLAIELTAAGPPGAAREAMAP